MARVLYLSYPSLHLLLPFVIHTPKESTNNQTQA